MYRIAVDFDGTIVENKYPKIGKPLPFAFETLKAFQKKGCVLILWTCREGELLDEAVVVLKDEIVLIGDRYYLKTKAQFIDVEEGENDEETSGESKISSLTVDELKDIIKDIISAELAPQDGLGGEMPGDEMAPMGDEIPAGDEMPGADMGADLGGDEFGVS